MRGDDSIFECFDGQVRPFQESEITPLLKRNLLQNFFMPYCPAGLALVLNTADLEKTEEQAKKGFSLTELEQLLRKSFPAVPAQKLQRHLERALDILLDLGLFSAKWDPDAGDQFWDRKFYFRSEMQKRLKGYGQYANPKLSQLQRILLLRLLAVGPQRDPEFFLRVLDINEYIAHIGDIIDPDHWNIHVEAHSATTYRSMWDFLSEISARKIYDCNIRFYHEKKKVTIYGLDEWINAAVRSIENSYAVEIEITQCKLRLLFLPATSPEFVDTGTGYYDIRIKQFIVVPIVNFRVSGRKLERPELDAIISELTKDLALAFLSKYNDNLCGKDGYKVNARFRLRALEYPEQYEREYTDFCNNVSNLHGSSSKELNIRLAHMGECRDQFIPEIIRDKSNKHELDLVECLERGLESHDPQKEGMTMLLSLPRKGDVLIQHLWEVCRERDSAFRARLEKFGGNRENGEFHSISDREFYLKARSRSGELRDLEALYVFDDAIDWGFTLKELLAKIEEIREPGVYLPKLSKICILPYVVNGKRYKSLMQECNELTRDVTFMDPYVTIR